MRISVIIPSYNACERLYNNLAALNRQTFPMADMEVIVVDNGSKDDTYNMLLHYKPSYSMSIIRFDNNFSRSFARNQGILHSTGDILLFHDSDMLAPCDFVEQHMKEREKENLVVCGVPWKRIYTFYYNKFSDYLTDNFKNRETTYKNETELNSLPDKKIIISENELDDMMLHKKGFDIQNNVGVLKNVYEEFGRNLNNYSLPWRFFVTSNCSLHRQTLLKTNLFDENFNSWGCEDLELGYRLFQRGCRFEVREEALSYHQEHPIDFSDGGFPNILYFSDKHPDIDVLLFYYYRYTTIDKNAINAVLKDIKIISEINQFEYLVDLFKRILISIRKKVEQNKGISRIRNDDLSNLNVKDFKRDLRILRSQYQIVDFPKAIYILVKRLYNVSI